MTDGETTLHRERASNYLLISSEGGAPAFASAIWPVGSAPGQMLSEHLHQGDGIFLVRKGKGDKGGSHHGLCCL